MYSRMSGGQIAPILEGNILKVYPVLDQNEIIWGNQRINCILSCPPEQCCNTFGTDDVSQMCKKCRVQSPGGGNVQGTNKTGMVNFPAGYCRDCGLVKYDIAQLAKQVSLQQNDVKMITNVVSIDCSQTISVDDIKNSNLSVGQIQNYCASTVNESPLTAILANKQTVIIVTVIIMSFIAIIFLAM